MKLKRIQVIKCRWTERKSQLIKLQINLNFIKKVYVLIHRVARTQLIFFPSPYEFRDPRFMYAGIHNSILIFRENKVKILTQANAQHVFS